MKIRSVVGLAGLTISFAMPAFAQQKDVVADPQIIQKIHAVGKAYDEGENNNDPAAIAGLFTEDAVFVTNTDQSTVDKPLRNGIKICSRDGTPKATSPSSMAMRHV